MLDWKWSPQQIAGVLKRVWPDDPTMHISHESIYTAIYAHPRGELRRQLIACQTDDSMTTVFTVEAELSVR
jgi:IS30 family transposase